MKLLSTSILVLSILVLFSTDLKAQTDDYVITTKGDTIKCRILTPFFVYNGSTKKYKIDGKSKKIKTDEIQEYYIARTDYRERAVIVNGKNKLEFLKVVENGIISLYEVVYNNTSPNGFSTSSVQWFIGKGSNKVTDFKSSTIYLGKSRKDRKSYFAELLKDKPQVYDKCMTDDKFSFDEIRNLVHLYNTGMPYVAPE